MSTPPTQAASGPAVQPSAAVPVPAAQAVTVIPGTGVPYHEHPAPRRRFPRRVWEALKSISLFVSMIINLILIVVVVILMNQVGAI